MFCCVWLPWICLRLKTDLVFLAKPNSRYKDFFYKKQPSKGRVFYSNGTISYDMFCCLFKKCFGHFHSHPKNKATAISILQYLLNKFVKDCFNIKFWISIYSHERRPSLLFVWKKLPTSLVTVFLLPKNRVFTVMEF